MELDKILSERYSVRKFKDEVISKEKLDKILEAGRIAPTAKNAQEQRIYVLQSPEALKKLDTATTMRFGSKTVLMICADMEKAPKIRIEDGYNTAEMDASIVCSYMMLEAWNVGIGSVWVRYFNAEQLRKTFSIPENIKPICLLPLGYIAEDAKPLEMHFKRNNIEDEVEYM